MAGTSRREGPGKVRKELEKVFEKHGYRDYRWIRARDIVVSQWVRMKCTFGCGDYAKCGGCPPNTPSVSECQDFFRGYKLGAVFHFTKRVDPPVAESPFKKAGGVCLRSFIGGTF